MAGEGRRFAEAGYDQPKPLIDVAGKPMIERVVDCLNPHSFGDVYFTLLDRATVGETQGAVDTLLHAEEMIEPGPVLVANCDQWIAPGVIDGFLGVVANVDDASVMTFNSTNPHHSYVKTRDGLVTEVIEKQVISDQAILGVYYFADSEVLFDYCRKVIANNLRHGTHREVQPRDPSGTRYVRRGGEFYISAVLNEFVKDGGELTAFEVDVHDKAMLGTPEELQIFLDKVNDGRVVL